MGQERTVYTVIFAIKAIAEVALEQFDTLAASQAKVAKGGEAVDLSRILRIIQGAAIDAEHLLAEGKLK